MSRMIICDRGEECSKRGCAFKQPYEFYMRVPLPYKISCDCMTGTTHLIEYGKVVVKDRGLNNWKGELP